MKKNRLVDYKKVAYQKCQQKKNNNTVHKTSAHLFQVKIDMTPYNLSNIQTSR